MELLSNFINDGIVTYISLHEAKFILKPAFIHHLHDQVLKAP